VSLSLVRTLITTLSYIVHAMVAVSYYTFEGPEEARGGECELIKISLQNLD
jgi:hypothetical protein